MKPTVPDNAPVAIIGIGCIFADSPDLKSFFRLFAQGISGISDPPPTHSYLRDYLDPDPKKPDHIYCNRGGYLPPIDFDPMEFGIPPNSLEATDTSQLLGLVTAKRAIEDAGYGENGKPFDRDRASVILGVTGTQELVIPLGSRLGHPLWRRALDQAGVPKHQADEVIERIGAGYVAWQENSFPGLLGNVVAGRIANRLDFGGTNCVVDAACASSMGAIHMALLELNSKRSDMVITGGVDTINDAFMHMCFAKTHLLSPSGDIRPFSKNADGTVLGEGVGLVVLKRLADAERDGDRIYAVIKGIGSASDGKAQSIYAPRKEGQVKALERAYACAQIDPSTVTLIEAHGTGTHVGDQVEFKALCEVFGAASPNGNKCAIGSVKSNIGHTKAAAGTAGLIKSALAIYHKVLPPTLKADLINPTLGIDHSPFYLNQHLRPWISKEGHLRKAGVSSFGFGGSNFHAVLEEHSPQKQEISWDGSIEIAAFSAETKEELTGRIEQWMQQVGESPTRHTIGKMALQSRFAFQSEADQRLIMVLRLTADNRSASQTCSHALAFLNGTSPSSRQDIYYGSGPRPGRVAFLFPGQGSQYINMGRDLICAFPDSLTSFQEAAGHLEAEKTLDDYVFPRTITDLKTQENQLRETHIAQPAIGAVCVSMLNALTHFGIAPHAACGHSYGELVALFAAGWISQADLWRLSSARGRLMAEAGTAESDPGAMLAVKGPLSEIEEMVRTLDLPLVLANRNSPQQGVLSGCATAIETAAETCRSRGWSAVRLPVAAAFHSALVSRAQAPFSRQVDPIHISPTDIDVMSNSHGGAYPRNIEAIKETIGKQLTRPVNFVQNIESLYESGVRTFIEIGPRQTLTHLVSAILSGRNFHAVALDRSSGRSSGLYDLAGVLAQLATLGYDVRLKRWEKSKAPLRRARMMIPLSGANYRPSKTESVNNQQPSDGEQNRSAAGYATPPRPVASYPASPKGSGENTTPERQTEPAGRGAMTPDNTQSIQNALLAAKKGLESLQALQSQTTKAHQKYLDTQAEASRVLKQMIQSTQQLASAALNGNAAAAATYESAASGASSIHAAIPPLDDMPQKTIEPGTSGATLEPTTGAAPETPGAQVTQSCSGTCPQQGSDLAQTLLSIVSELTGYPEQMLGLDMDIESDLGIDSIKRVEILSALEEKMPHLPQVTPDMMGTLKTLAQICDFLAGPANDPVRPADAAATAPPAAEPSETPQVRQTLLSIVSELTGYPEQMLGLDMDIESDLGIDSIKRVEILSALEEKMPHLPQVTPDMMGTLKTLAQICDFLAGGRTETIGVIDHAGAEKESETASSDDGVSQVLSRKRIRVRDMPRKIEQRWTIPEGGFVGVVGSNETATQALIQALDKKDIAARSLTDPGDAAGRKGLVGLILLAPIEAQLAFEWAKLASAFETFPESDGTCFCTVTYLDGAFGFNNSPLDDPVQGALAGLAKTAAVEWPSVRCLALDIDPGWTQPEAVADEIALELAYPQSDGVVEIGLSAERRIQLELEIRPLTRTAAIDLSHDDVVVVTGGARGVTASAAQALAARCGCKLALLGRTRISPDEPNWLNGLAEPGEMKAAILAHHFSDGDPTPLQVESAYQSFVSMRQIKDAMGRLSAEGRTARYYSVDVRDPHNMARTFDVIRKELGDIKAIIHGAGVLADRLIAEKQPEQFQHVFETKVNGMQALINAATSDDLRYLVLFSSVSARLGNAGQSDYAMANEALNKIARQQARRWPDCKVLSINWGPWDGGMVTPNLKAAFEARGIGLIPPMAGADAMLDEMSSPESNEIEIVIGALLHSSRMSDAIDTSMKHDIPAPVPQMSITARRDIDIDRHPVLRSHQLDGRPVVPLALMTEWLAHSALHSNPGLSLHGLDQLRLLNGIVLDKKSTSVRIMAAKARRVQDRYEVDVEIRDDSRQESDLIHSSAKAVLVERHPTPPPFKRMDAVDDRPADHSLEEVYEQILFHGKALRGLQHITQLTELEMAARIAPAPPPADWMDKPMRSRWIMDPLVIDSAFQMAIVWCHNQLGLVSLPSYAESYRQYRDRFPKNGVSAFMRVQHHTKHKMICDFTFLDEDRQVVATLDGYQAVMTPTLMRAFKAA